MKRRSVMSILLAGPTVAAPLASVWALTSDADVQAVLRSPLADTADPTAPKFDEFYRICQIICLRQELDETTAHRIYDLIKVEPWGVNHVAAVYNVVRDHPDEDGNLQPVATLIQKGHFGEGEAWFISHLLTTWYLGIYYHEVVPEPVRVSFDTSLMWDVVASRMAAPGFLAAAPGDWSKPPADAPEVRE